MAKKEKNPAQVSTDETSTGNILTELLNADLKDKQEKRFSILTETDTRTILLKNENRKNKLVL